MKHSLALFTSSALLLSAASFWDTKPFTEWSDKEMQKMMNDSPWAKKVSISTEGPSTQGISGNSGVNARGGGGGGRGGGADENSAPEPISAGGGGGRGGGGAGAGPGGGPDISPMASTEVIVRWQTALPLKQAIAKARYGKEVNTSPEAKKFLEREEQYYVVSVLQMPLRVRTGEEFRQALIKSATLNVKGKDSVPAADAQMELQPRTRAIDVYFLFPRQRAFTLEDSEIEFNAKVGGIPVKQRFKLKEMTFNGKLEL